MSNVDLILRWAVLRMADGNSQTLGRVLELTRALLCTLGDQGIPLAELDAHVLLPAVVEKAGHAQVRGWGTLTGLGVPWGCLATAQAGRAHSAAQVDRRERGPSEG